MPRFGVEWKMAYNISALGPLFIQMGDSMRIHMQFSTYIYFNTAFISYTYVNKHVDASVGEFTHQHTRISTDRFLLSTHS